MIHSVFSDDYFLSKTGVAILHEYLVECYHTETQQFATQPVTRYSSGQKPVALNANQVSKGAKIRNRYYQVPHLTQDTNGKVTNSQPDTTNESQEVSHIPAGNHNAQINRRTQRHNKHRTEKHIRSTKEVAPWNGQ